MQIASGTVASFHYTLRGEPYPATFFDFPVE